jgi:hypothetical protein
MFGKYNGFVSKARVSACMCYLVIINDHFNVGRSILEATAKQLEVKPTVSTTYSQTRFASLAYVQWQCLVKSYKLFTAALKNGIV